MPLALAGRRAGQGGRGSLVSGSLSDSLVSEQHISVSRTSRPPQKYSPGSPWGLPPLAVLNAGHWGHGNNSGHPMGEMGMSTVLTLGAQEESGMPRDLGSWGAL